jgi:hypothetical protein
MSNIEKGCGGEYEVRDSKKLKVYEKAIGRNNQFRH